MAACDLPLRSFWITLPFGGVGVDDDFGDVHGNRMLSEAQATVWRRALPHTLSHVPDGSSHVIVCGAEGTVQHPTVPSQRAQRKRVALK